MVKRVRYPWEIKKLTYKEWSIINFDWDNQSKIDKWIPAYLFRYNNYQKGLKNKHILKSTFGRKTIIEIKEEIEMFYKICIGAYTKIEYK